MQERLDTFSVGTHGENSLGLLIETYQKLLPSMRVRTYNVMKAWQQTFPDIGLFLQHFLGASYKEIKELRNCGRLTIKEILSLQDTLNDLSDTPLPAEANETPEPELEVTKHILTSNIDELLPLFKATIEGLSTRSDNRINWLLEECNNSLSAFYERICDPDCIKSIPTIGRKSTPEIKDFFVRARLFLEQFPDEESVSSRVKHHLIASPTALGLPNEAMELLREQEDALGYFPMFAAIQLFLDNQPEEKKTLIDGCLYIHQGQELPERDEVAEVLKLSPERVRQKRNKLIGKLPDYFKTYYNLGFITENPYRYQMTHYEDDINAAEGTDFSLNFITWVLGSVFDDLTLIGDPVKSIGGYFDTDQYLCIVPTALTRLFDFEAFIEDLENRMQERRMGEEKVNLKSLINAHLKVQYCEDELPEIETTCRSILYLHFPVEVDLGNVILPANAYKTNQFILEEILRAAGHPMTFDELYEEYLYQYPERDSTESSLRGAIGGNKNIVPFGRTSTYGLREWNNSSYRGGTIREFVCEYLDSLDEPIAPADDVCEYVRRFRPDTSDSSISSNLMQEQSRKFVVLVKDGVRYFGYSNANYGDEYKVVGGDRRMKRTTQESMQLLEEFILREGRYPYHNEDDEEEYRLYRFIGNRRSACSRNVIPLEEIEEWRAFEEKYKEYIISRPFKRRTKQ